MNLAFDRRGSGAPMVLLHGIGHHRRGWTPVVDKLAATHDVIAVDLPGFGESVVHDVGDMTGLVDAMARFFAVLGLDRPHVAGNSLGGAIALELASAGHVSSATALSPAGFYTPREGRRALGLLKGLRMSTRLPEPVLRTVLRSKRIRAMSFGPIVAHPSRLSAEDALADALAMRRGKAFGPVAKAGRGYAFAGSPAVPVTIAWGTRDRVLPYRQAAVARERLPLADHVDLPGCGHVPMSDDPDLVASVILRTAGRA